MEVSIKWNLCRVCLREEPKNVKGDAFGSSDQMRHLFNEDKKLAYHIYQLSGVFMKPGDSLPDKICRKCVSIVNNAVQFRKTCRSSNVYLQSALERTKTATSTFFTPESLTCQGSDEDETEDYKMETEPASVTENEFEQRNLEKRKIGVTTIRQKKKKDSQNIENMNLDQQEREVQQGITDNTEELEEIIEISEEMEDQILTETVEDDAQDNAEVSNINIEYIKCETSQLDTFHVSTSFAKLKSNDEGKPDNKRNDDSELVENGQIKLSNLKENGEEMYHIFKVIKNENSNDEHEGLENHGEHHSMTEDLEYIVPEEEEKVENDIEESLMLQLEDKSYDNETQAQVSSTVDTNDEIEYYEHDSDASNLQSELDEEFLVDENYGHFSIKKLTSDDNTNSDAIKSERILTYSPMEKTKSFVIHPRRKIKGNLINSGPNDSVKVCVCELCGNQFTNRNLMNIHMKVHYQQKNHQCELCFKRFITACNLQAHMRIHTGERPFECKYCGRRFNDRSSNLRHERTHTNEKPFECASCGKSFSLATTLQNHMKVHTNERSYKCEPCGKSFKLPHHLKTHQNTSLHRSVLQIGVDEN